MEYRSIDFRLTIQKGHDLCYAVRKQYKIKYYFRIDMNILREH